jgi:trk system potassium uptake protein TrkH
VYLDLRPVVMTIGLLLTILSGGMLVPAVADMQAGHADWQVFAWSGAVGIFTGLAMLLAARGPSMGLNLRQAFLLTVLTWLVLPAFAAVPLALSELDLSYTDAFFESMSGITTTGSTVIVGLDTAPPGILLWRGILQWLGGIGIIIMALTVLPMLRVGGMQMFRVEAFEAQEKVFSRATELASALSLLYALLTGAWTLMLWMAGMPPLDAVIHAMTTLATGGYSSRDDSVGAFDSALIDAIITAGMVVGGIPFLLYLQAVRGNGHALLRDTQVQWFLGIVVVFSLAIAAWLWRVDGLEFLRALRYASFSTVSVLTGTGYATADYSTWVGFPMMSLFFLMFVGGCAGSTSCGIKIFRFQILYQTARLQLARLLQPHGVFVAYFNHRPIQPGVPEAVMGFFFLYAISTAVLAMLLGLLGLDFVTALSSAATAISNVGPGLGPVVGPAGNFSTLPDSAKWLMSFGMLLGRLELYTVLVLLLPRFWRD